MAARERDEGFVPVELEAIDVQTWSWAGPESVWSVQVAPELDEVQMSPFVDPLSSPPPPATR